MAKESKCPLTWCIHYKKCNFDDYKECAIVQQEMEGETKSPQFNLSNINIGELIRFKDKLLKTKVITKTKFDVITDYLAFFIVEGID